MPKNTVSVSIVAANFNNGRYLKEFVSSILKSSVLPKELIIINDGSTDDSIEILDSFSDITFLKVIKFKENKGFCEALNAGIELASGKYIMRIDPDDIVLKQRIYKQYNYLENNKDIDIVGSNVIYFNDETGENISKSNFPILHNDIYKSYSNGEHGIQHPSALIRAEVMKKFKYLQENFKSEDYDIFARIIVAGHKFANIPEPLTRMRVHGNSVSIHIKFATIEQTFDLRDQIFNRTTSQLKRKFYYWHILYYKRYLISKRPIVKLFNLVLSGIFYPSKVFKRI